MDEAAILRSFSVEFDSGIPAYKQIINQVCSMIGCDILKEGDQLPTIRSLTEALRLNPNTVAKAFRELELKGTITSQRGRGSYIAPASTQPLNKKARKAKIEAFYSRMLSEARGAGIEEQELRDFIKEKR